MKLQQALKRDIKRILKEYYRERMCYEQLCFLVLAHLINDYGYHVDSVLKQGRLIRIEINNYLGTLNQYF